MAGGIWGRGRGAAETNVTSKCQAVPLVNTGGREKETGPHKPTSELDVKNGVKESWEGTEVAWTDVPPGLSRRGTGNQSSEVGMQGRCRSSECPGARVLTKTSLPPA